MIIWQPENQPISVISPKNNGPVVKIGACTITPNEKYFITSDRAGVVSIWSLATGEFVRSFDFHDAFIDRIACSVDEEYIACGTRRSRNPVRLWHISTGDLSLEAEVGLLGNLFFCMKE